MMFAGLPPQKEARLLGDYSTPLRLFINVEIVALGGDRSRGSAHDHPRIHLDEVGAEIGAHYNEKLVQASSSADSVNTWRRYLFTKSGVDVHGERT